MAPRTTHNQLSGISGISGMIAGVDSTLTGRALEIEKKKKKKKKRKKKKKKKKKKKRR